MVTLFAPPVGAGCGPTWPSEAQPTKGTVVVIATAAADAGAPLVALAEDGGPAGLPQLATVIESAPMAAARIHWFAIHSSPAADAPTLPAPGASVKRRSGGVLFQRAVIGLP
jgi:hypothetical protein